MCNSVTIVDSTLEDAETKWWVGFSPGSGLIAPATARSVTRRGQDSPNTQLSMWKMPECVSFLFQWPQLPCMENERGREGKQAMGIDILHHQGLTKAVWVTKELRLLVSPCPWKEIKSNQQGLCGSYFPVILSLQPLVSVRYRVTLTKL